MLPTTTVRNVVKSSRLLYLILLFVIRMLGNVKGEMTSQEDVEVIRYGIREQTDMRVCLLNYRKNGTAFLNQFNLSPLRDVSGRLVRWFVHAALATGA